MQEGRKGGGWRGLTYLHGGCGKGGRKEGAGWGIWVEAGQQMAEGSSADEYTRSNNGGTISLFHPTPFLIFSRQQQLLSVGHRFLSTSIHLHTRHPTKWSQHASAHPLPRHRTPLSFPKTTSHMSRSQNEEHKCSRSSEQSTRPKRSRRRRNWKGRWRRN